MAQRFRLFPEMDRFDDPKEARAAFDRARTRLIRTWGFWLGGVAASIVLVIVLTVLIVFVMRRMGIPTGVTGGVIGGVLGGQIWGAMMLVYRRPLRLALRQELVSAGVPICVPCGYDLRGQRSPRCPECGAEFDAKLVRGADLESPAGS